MEEKQKFVKAISPSVAVKYGKPHQIFAVMQEKVNGEYILANSNGNEFLALIHEFEEVLMDTKDPHYKNWLAMWFPLLFNKKHTETIIKPHKEAVAVAEPTNIPESRTLKNIASYNDAAMKQMLDDFNTQPMVFTPEKDLKVNFSAEDLAKLKLQEKPSPEKQPLDLNKVVVEQFFSIRSEGDYAQKGFYLHPDYDYKIVIDNQNKPVLLLLEK